MVPTHAVLRNFAGYSCLDTGEKPKLQRVWSKFGDFNAHARFLCNPKFGYLYKPKHCISLYYVHASRVCVNGTICSTLPSNMSM